MHTSKVSGSRVHEKGVGFQTTHALEREGKP